MYILKATLRLARHYILESWENLRFCSLSLSVLGDAVEICCFSQLYPVYFGILLLIFKWIRVFQLFHCWPKSTAPKCSTFTVSHLSPECNLWHSWSEGWDFSAFILASAPSEFKKPFAFRGKWVQSETNVESLEILILGVTSLSLVFESDPHLECTRMASLI